MATIAIELGKVSSKNTREVYLLVRQGKSRRRVKTGVKLSLSIRKRLAELSLLQKQELLKSSEMSLRTIWRQLNKPP